MKLYNLSASQTTPCIVVKFNTCTIMLDCCLDFRSVANFLPLFIGNRPTFLQNASRQEVKDEHGNSNFSCEIKEIFGRAFVDSNPEFNPPEVDLINLSTIDVILISNFFSITALPFITEYSKFKGQVFATEPTKEFGRLLMEELVEFCNKVPKDRHASMWRIPRNKKLRQLPSSLQRCWEQRLSSWRQIYTADDLYNSLKKVKDIAYAEKLTVYGALNVTAYSSGYTIGGCNWTIKSDFEKIVYMSGTSKLSSHPQTLEEKPLENADLMIFTGLTEVPAHDPMRIINDFTNTIIKTAKQGGNTLIPCLPCGIIFDLLETLINVTDSIDCRDFTIYFVSPSAKGSLAFSQIYAEWLHQEKQNKAYLPEQPFGHEELRIGGKLRIFPSVRDGMSNNFKQPCVVFAGHPSLRFGDAIHFMDLWSKSSLNSIIFVDSSFSHVDALAPYQPINARTYYFPIDSRLDHKDATLIINKLNPKRLVVPQPYLSPPPTAPHRNDLRLNTKCRPQSLDISSAMKVDLKRSFEKVHLTPKLAGSIVPHQHPSGVLISPISAYLDTNDNKHTFLPYSKRRKIETGNQRKRVKVVDDVTHRPLCVGSMSLELLLNELRQDSFFNDAKMDESKKSIVMANAVVEERDNETFVTYKSMEDRVRVRMTDILLRTLKAN